MKKILTALVGVILLSGVLVQASQNSGDSSLNGAYPSPNTTSIGTDILTLKMKPGYSTPVSSDVALGVNARGVLYNTYGIFNQLDIFPDIFIASSDTVRLGGVALTTITANMGNGTILSSMTAGGTTYITIDISSQPLSCPRNITVRASSGVAAAGIGVFSTTTIRGQVQVFGVDGNGNSMTETILFSSAAPVSTTGTAVAGDLGQLTSFTTNYGQGRVAWASISSFTITLTSVTRTYENEIHTFAINIGYGNRLGLSNDLRYFGDVYKIVENGSTQTDQVPQNGLIDSDFNTYTPVNAPNSSRDYSVWYRVKNSPRK